MFFRNTVSFSTQYSYKQVDFVNNSFSCACHELLIDRIENKHKFNISWHTKWTCLLIKWTQIFQFLSTIFTIKVKSWSFSQLSWFSLSWSVKSLTNNISFSGSLSIFLQLGRTLEFTCKVMLGSTMLCTGRRSWVNWASKFARAALTVCMALSR